MYAASLYPYPKVHAALMSGLHLPHRRFHTDTHNLSSRNLVYKPTIQHVQIYGLVLRNPNPNVLPCPHSHAACPPAHPIARVCGAQTFLSQPPHDLCAFQHVALHPLCGHGHRPHGTGCREVCGQIIRGGSVGVCACVLGVCVCA